MKKKVLYIGIIFFLLFINIGNVEGVSEVKCVYKLDKDVNSLKGTDHRYPNSVTLSRNINETKWKSTVKNSGITNEYSGDKCPKWIAYISGGKIYLPENSNNALNIYAYNFPDKVDSMVYTNDIKKSNIPTNNVDNSNKSNTSSKLTYETISCGEGMEIPVGIPKFVASIVTIMKYLVPVALIAMCIYDFIKAIITSDQTIIKNTIPNVIRRLIGAIAVFFVLAIVQFLFGLVSTDYEPLSCVQCFITGDC